MSEATAETAGKSKTRYKRSAKNYLLDRHFQLKYTGFLVGIAVFLSIALGAIVWVTSSKVIEQSQTTVQQGKEQVELGKETVERGKEVVVQSRKVSQVVAMNIAKEYADDPELAKTFSEEASKDEQKLALEQNRLEQDAVYLQQRAAALEKQAEDVEQQQTNLLVGIILVLTMLVGGIGFAGIIFTHKIAGPVFKMKRLLREVGEGSLVVREKLRKGDELHHFFETFETMVGDLRRKQEREIDRVDAIIADLDEGDASEKHQKGIESLRELRGEMQAQLEA